jgi:mono/diheme cytochrome c family protein
MSPVLRLFALTLVTLTPVTLGLTGPAHAMGLPGEGEKIAQRWCAACHVISNNQASASADVPTFDAIAEKYGQSFEAFEALLADPHPDMPQMVLTRQDIRNLLAYINSRR